jgi:hypothetical protein
VPMANKSSLPFWSLFLYFFVFPISHIRATCYMLHWSLPLRLHSPDIFLNKSRNDKISHIIIAILLLTPHPYIKIFTFF